MIETGSFDGLSTAVILLAMAKNTKGTLFTIDLPNPRLPRDIEAEPAWIVPDYLRNRLQLKIGKSSEHLESIIEQVGEVDLFYHDSWHTYDNLMFEYQTVWSALSLGGLLMSEYLPDLNDAFKDFIKDKTNIPTILANNTQFILQKSQGE
jgi:predicted O-methyltransferase YrrM